MLTDPATVAGGPLETVLCSHKDPKRRQVPTTMVEPIAPLSADTKIYFDTIRTFTQDVFDPRRYFGQVQATDLQKVLDKWLALKVTCKIP